MMKLRKLEKKDAPFMLEWMHDPEINCNFRFNGFEQTLKSAEQYIEETRKDDKNHHFAIVDEEDQYLGTISLKKIDYKNQKAEYAICLRKEAQGKGFAYLATKKILDYGFIRLGLNRIYLNVLSENKKANRFYQKFGFIYEGCSKEDVIICETKKDLLWYRILNCEYTNIKWR